MGGWKAYDQSIHIVTRDTPGKAWLHVRGPEQAPTDHRQLTSLCADLVAWLNGGRTRPAWLDRMHRIDEEHIIGDDGTLIFAEGPFFTPSIGTSSPIQREDPASQDSRARAVDLVWNRRRDPAGDL